MIVSVSIVLLLGVLVCLLIRYTKLRVWQALVCVLFGFYHLHEPWVIPNAIITGFLCAYPTRRFRSAWMGICIHSVESIFFLIILFPLVAS